MYLITAFENVMMRHRRKCLLCALKCKMYLHLMSYEYHFFGQKREKFFCIHSCFFDIFTYNLQ